MMPGRNELCPCGSGKKYKKCCFLTEQNEAIADVDDAAVETAEMMLHALNHLRMLELRVKPHIKEYNSIRKMHGEIINAMARYHDDDKFERRFDKTSVSSNEETAYLRMIESSFDFETHEGVHAFYDMMIYKIAPNMNCITEDFLNRHRYRRPEKIAFLESMLQSRLGLFEVTEIDPGEGYAYLKEVFSGETYQVTDIGMSGNLNYDSYYIYTRLIAYRGINLNTGLNLIFSKKDDYIIRFIRDHRKDYVPNREFLRFTQLYNYYLGMQDKLIPITNSLE